MANFVAIVDQDTDRRRAFMHAAEAQIAFLPALRVGHMTLGSFALAWAAGDRAPIDSFLDADTAAIVWGDAIGDAGRMEARQLATDWDPGRVPVPPAFDGFHAALRYDPTHGLTLGGDVFGIFPLYYAAGAGVTIVASSAELIASHPVFPAILDREGLAGLLLAYGSLGGRTLHRAVRRLAPGCALRSSREGVREVANFRIASSPTDTRLAFPDALERLHVAYAAALARHAPPEVPLGLLLSGGRDSRMLCGYLGEQVRGLPAVTLGEPADYEARCARKVATRLGLQHMIVGLPASERPGHAQLQARWEHLQGGFSSVHMWAALPALRQLPSRFLTGYLRESLDFAAPSLDFDALFASSYNRGFRAPDLRRLLDASWHGVINERLDVLRETYVRSADHEEERPWRFQLAHYARTHAGGVPWRLSFASWPVMPILDRALLNTIASVPLAHLANRRAQDALLRRYFPSLARLPLDRNHHDTAPLLPGTVRRWLNPLVIAARERRARAGHGTPNKPRAAERRYYYRVYDIDGPGWRAVRQVAEPHRERLATLFDMAELDRWLPAPDTTMGLADPIADAFRPKLLLGLMLWAAGHVP